MISIAHAMAAEIPWSELQVLAVGRYNPAMVETPENLMLVYLRRIDETVSRLRDDVREIKHRLTSLEAAVGLLHGDFAGQSGRIDRVETRLERIEQRLDLRDA